MTRAYTVGCFAFSPFQDMCQSDSMCKYFLARKEINKGKLKGIQEKDLKKPKLAKISRPFR